MLLLAWSAPTRSAGLPAVATIAQAVELHRHRPGGAELPAVDLLHLVLPTSFR